MEAAVPLRPIVVVMVALLASCQSSTDSGPPQPTRC